MYLCKLIEIRFYSTANTGVCCVQSELNTAGFVLLTHTYLCTQRAHKGLKGTVVNRIALFNGELYEITLTIPF